MNGEARDSGTGYEVRPGTSDRRLVETSFGTPMGELLRRYWHPVGVAADASTTPRQIRVLSEDLILFRDPAGRPGLLYPRCAHRGTSLIFGKVEDRGIRCCYHGWLFDRTGHCVEQPCEPGGGRARGAIRQPWYPLEERYGLIFAYLGPPDRKPVLPRYDLLEDLEDGDSIATDANSIGTGGDAIAPWNWMQHYDNVIDPYHVPVLHGSFSGTQFVDLLATMPEVRFAPTPQGVIAEAIRPLEDGKILRRVTEAVFPTLRIIPDPAVSRFGRGESVGWLLPMDDTHYRIYTAFRARDGEKRNRGQRPNGKRWQDLTEAERRDSPGDWEAQIGQGTITLHSEEHLASSDRGLALVRRMFRDNLDTVERGGDPAGVHFDEADALVRTHAGNFREEPVPA